MTEWRAHLRPPRDEYVLGAVISGLEGRVSKARGFPYILVRFENYPFVAVWSAYDQQRFQRAVGCLSSDLPLTQGSTVHLFVRWRPRPDQPEVVVPDVRVDADSIIAMLLAA
jgi:hypothetical protein